MKKKYLFFTIVLGMQTLIYSTTEPIIKSSHQGQQQHPHKKRKNPILILSAIGGISTLFNGSIFFIVFTLMRYIFQSKASQAAHNELKEKVILLENIAAKLETLLDIKIENLNNEQDILKNILNQVHESINKQTQNIDGLVIEVQKVNIVSLGTAEKVTTLEAGSTEIKNLMIIEDKKIDLQKKEIDEANNKLGTISSEINDLKKFDIDHNKTLKNFIEKLDLTDQALCNLNQKIDILNASNEAINQDIKIIKQQSSEIHVKLDTFASNQKLKLLNNNN